MYALGDSMVDNYPGFTIHRIHSCILCDLIDILRKILSLNPSNSYNGMTQNNFKKMCDLMNECRRCVKLESYCHHQWRNVQEFFLIKVLFSKKIESECEIAIIQRLFVVFHKTSYNYESNYSHLC